MLIKKIATKCLKTRRNVLFSTHEDTKGEIIKDDINYNEVKSNEVNLTSNKSERILTNNKVKTYC